MKDTYSGTERKKAQMELSASEQRFRDLWENAPVAYHTEEQFRDLVEKSGMAIITDDCEGNLIYFNDRYAAIFGYSNEEMRTRTIWSTVHPDEVEKLRTYHAGRIAGRDIPSRYELKGVRKDGSTIFLEVDTVVIRNGNRPVGTYSYLWDITERKRAEDKRRESDERLRSIAEHSHDGILILDDTFHIIYANRESAGISGYAREELVGRNFAVFIDDEGRELVRDLYVRRQRGEKVPPRYEFNIIRKDGKKRRLEISSSVVAGAGGKVETIAQLRDITEQKKAEEELRASEEKFKILFEYAPDSYYLTDVKGNLIYANKAAEKMLGYNREELIGKSLLVKGVMSSVQIPKALSLLAKNALGYPTGPEEFALQRKDGSDISVEIRAYAVKMNGETMILGIARDVTERKKAEEKLRESEEKFKSISACAQDAILMMDNRGRVSYWNRAAEGIFGYTAEEAFGQEIHSWLAPESFRAVSFEHLERFKETGRGSALGRIIELEAIRKDGARIPIELSLSAVKLQGEWHAIAIVRDISQHRNAKKQLEETLQRLQKSFDAIIQAVSLTIDMRDPYTSDHQRRVAELAPVIAAEMNLSADQIESIRIASLLHDMGKFAVPAEILSKPGRLDDAELDLIREHPKTGFDILSKIDLPGGIAQIVYQHHERVNGSGYPRGLAGQDILVEARVLSVAEAVEAMTSHRPYRPALGIEEALREITRAKGILFDPEVVEACLKVFVINKFEFKLGILSPRTGILFP
ncbi:MAG: PAS domain S-box protein [Candidatus Aminicenantales bacterium]